MRTNGLIIKTGNGLALRFQPFRAMWKWVNSIFIRETHCRGGGVGPKDELNAVLSVTTRYHYYIGPITSC